MKTNITIFLVLATLVAIQSSCAAKQTPDGININPKTIGSANDVNQTIIVSAPPEWNKYKLDDVVYLWVVLNSDHTVILNDQNVNIYAQNKAGWVQVKHMVLRSSVNYILAPNKIEALRSAEVVAVPDLAGYSETTILRIIVSGNIYDNSIMGEQVSAYVDVTLKP